MSEFPALANCLFFSVNHSFAQIKQNNEQFAQKTETDFSNFVIKYLGKIETEFENTLSCLSGAQMGSNHGKKTKVKKLPFRNVFQLNFT